MLKGYEPGFSALLRCKMISFVRNPIRTSYSGPDTRVAASLGLPDNNFVTDSCKIWRNETIIIIEKTRMPRGSRRRRPTGNLCWRRRIFQATNLLVVHIIKVQSKSRAESTREATREREEEKKAAHILAMRRRMLARTLICRGYQSLYNVSSCKN